MTALLAKRGERLRLLGGKANGNKRNGFSDMKKGKTFVCGILKGGETKKKGKRAPPRRNGNF